MEKMGEDRREEELKYSNAIRCAKVATLLSSLKNATSNSSSEVPQFQDEAKIEMLKIELVKNKRKLKKLQHWIGTSLLSYFLFLIISLLSSISPEIGYPPFDRNGVFTIFTQFLDYIIICSALVRYRKLFLVLNYGRTDPLSISIVL